MVETARTLIHSKNLSLDLWAGGVNTATFVRNRSGTSSIKGKTPYELWHQKEADFNYFQTFGTEAFVHIPKQKRRKWDKKAEEGIMVGYGDGVNGYRIFFPDGNVIETHCDVKFIEQSSTNSQDEHNNDNDHVDIQQAVEQLSLKTAATTPDEQVIDSELSETTDVDDDDESQVSENETSDVSEYTPNDTETTQNDESYINNNETLDNPMNTSAEYDSADSRTIDSADGNKCMAWVQVTGCAVMVVLTGFTRHVLVSMHQLQIRLFLF